MRLRSRVARARVFAESVIPPGQDPGPGPCERLIAKIRADNPGWTQIGVLNEAIKAMARLGDYADFFTHEMRKGRSGVTDL
jgi:hypothetical protein